MVIFHFFVIHLRVGPLKGTPVRKVCFVRINQQSEVGIEPGTSRWEARMLPLCHAVPHSRKYIARQKSQ